MNCFELVRILKFRIAAVVAETANITFEQAEMMRTLFRTMARLTDDDEVKALCAYGASQADSQANGIGVIRERAMKAGLIAERAVSPV
jgi:hypothetical protein